MKTCSTQTIETPYEGVDEQNYQIEKRRLQLEILKIQQQLMKNGQRLVITFDGRDAAGKGSTIKRFSENLIPSNFNIVELGIPTAKEAKYWFRRYEKYLSKPGHITFFDRSWYNRALIEPTMGYCNEAQYKYFMKKVLPWEHQQMANGLHLVKFYLSINSETQLVRFEDRLKNPLTFWKFSENDLKARKRWRTFTNYKEQMLSHTSSNTSPWVVINANKKKEARLTSMLYLVRLFGNRNFTPLTGQDITASHSIKFAGVKFQGLTNQQLAVLKELNDQEKALIESPEG